MKQKWINWFRHVQKCQINHKNLQSNLYEYACREIRETHNSIERSFAAEFKYMNRGCYEDFCIEKEADNAYIDTLAKYSNPVFDIEEYELMKCTYTECNRILDCTYEGRNISFKFPGSLFYQSSPSSTIYVCNVKEIYKLVQMIEPVIDIFDIRTHIGNNYRMHEKLDKYQYCNNEKLSIIDNFGRSYLKHWSRYRIGYMDNSMILYDNRKEYIIEIEESVDLATLQAYWNMLQQAVKHPYFDYLYRNII